jgi:hypothetical protein
MRRVFAIVLVCAACNSNSDRAPNPPPPSGLPVGFGATEMEAITAQPGSKSFDVNTTRDIWAAIALSSMPSVVIVHYRTTAPNGVVFTEKIAAFQLNPAPGAAIQIDGYTVPLPIDAARAVNGKMLLPVRLAISGTDYQRHPYPGAWTIHFSIDDMPSAETSATFELKVGP